MRNGILKVSIKNKYTNKMKLWAVGMNGLRYAEIPFKISEKRAELIINTGLLKSGSTPFFELSVP